MDRVYVMQLVRSFQVGEMSRREFLKRATIAVGSLAAANTILTACGVSPKNPPPVVEQEPATPTAAPADPTATSEPATSPTAAGNEIAAGASGGVTYPDGAGGTLMGYLSRPEDTSPRPGVIVIQEWWGLNDHIKDVVQRFAAAGFVALAPDLYHGVVVTEPDEARKQVMALDMQVAVGEIQQAILFLQKQSFVSGSGVGLVGFCMGGGLVLQTARVEENTGAAVAFYGSPLAAEEAAEVKAPVLGLYGANDQGIPVESVRAMEQALNDTGIENEIHIYDTAGHAFFNDTRESTYNADAAADAWARVVEWFGKYLG